MKKSNFNLSHIIVSISEMAKYFNENWRVGIKKYMKLNKGWIVLNILKNEFIKNWCKKSFRVQCELLTYVFFRIDKSNKIIDGVFQIEQNLSFIFR